MSANDASDAKKDGPSKKELNKLARKEKKTAGPKESGTPNLVVNFSKGFSPELTHALSIVLGDAVAIAYTIDKSPDAHLPVLTSATNLNGGVSGDANIARFIARTNSLDHYGKGDAWFSSQIDQWLDVYSFAMNSTSFLNGIPKLVDSHMADRTLLVGEDFSLADIAVVLLMKKLNFAPSAAFVNASRWFEFASSKLPAIPAIPVTFVPQPAATTTAKKGGDDAASAEKKANVNVNVAVEDGGSCPPLEGAIEGQVCTRFPPEPSGYLHIGHAKAVLLNQYYAQRYKGRLLVRFDDTNPSKEKEEFAENIMRDLQTLNVKADAVSHSSDHFDKCQEIARKLILEGKAYMDDTEQEVMQAERLAKIESKHRNSDPKVNLEIFEKLLKGEKDAQKFCLRAKIDMSSVNGTMRDPVLYRYNATPHHRTGTKYKAYPTYDFVCPIVDSIEGVTHALRTTEYNDRDEQYAWLQDAMGLRKVHIHAFGKMNFVHTVLSKRKLTWFVENKLVEGWFDPRFPTIQGCVRRGMNVEALKNFIIGQGASRRIITMEWDKFWSENKKVLEEKACRYMGVNTEDAVTMHIENVGDEITAVSVPVHPQKPEMGTRVMRKWNRVLIDQADALTYAVGEDVTLLRWGNMKITEIVAEAGKVKSIKATYDAAAINFSKTKKATWIAAVPDLVPCKIFEFDHLISKAKLADEDKFEDFINPVTKIESSALCDPCLRTVAEGEVIQLERKGFFRCDKPYGGPDKPAVLFSIPDGKVKASSAAAETAASKKKK